MRLYAVARKQAILLWWVDDVYLQAACTRFVSLLGTKSFENIYKPGTEGALQGFIKGAGQGLGQAAGAAVAG